MQFTSLLTESFNSQRDCVPSAVSHMKFVATTYARAESFCMVSGNCDFGPKQLDHLSAPHCNGLHCLIPSAQNRERRFLTEALYAEKYAGGGLLPNGLLESSESRCSREHCKRA